MFMINSLKQKRIWIYNKFNLLILRRKDGWKQSMKEDYVLMDKNDEKNRCFPYSVNFLSKCQRQNVNEVVKDMKRRNIFCRK